MNSVLTLFNQVINNTYGAQYSTYNSDGSYSVQNIYNEDFNSTRIQNTTYSHLKFNYKNKIFDGNEDIRKELLESEIQDIYSAINNNEFNYRPLLNLLNNMLGLKLNKDVLLATIEDMGKVDNKLEGTVPAKTLANAIDDLIDKMKLDIGSTDEKNPSEFIKSLKNSKDTFTKMDSSVSKFIANTITSPLYNAIREAILEEYTIEPVMNAEMQNGNSIPSFTLPNLTYKDTELFELQRKSEKENPGKFKSLLLNSDPVIAGTLIKLEVVDKSNLVDNSREYDKLSVIEQFNSDFIFDFLTNIKDKDKFSVIIGNYSDKSRIFAKLINATSKLSNDSKEIVLDSIDNILNKIKSQAFNYYKDTTDHVFGEFNKFFQAIGLNFKLSNNFETNVTNINKILSENKLSDLISQYASLPNTDKSGIKIVEEEHYSTYNTSDNKKITLLNNYLLNNYRIFNSDELFKEFVSRTENSLKKKLANIFVKDKSLSLEEKINKAEIDLLNKKDIKGEV